MLFQNYLSCCKRPCSPISWFEKHLGASPVPPPAPCGSRALICMQATIGFAAVSFWVSARCIWFQNYLGHSGDDPIPTSSSKKT